MLPLVVKNNEKPFGLKIVCNKSCPFNLHNSIKIISRHDRRHMFDILAHIYKIQHLDRMTNL